ncbi:hypothetical protein BMF94_4420 [Rhodotorula taiwanensis]|uniref:DUF1690 domain-containing protein n=1 Tax=Rhodotorula taiwanensis TaxID=741276 RepID=A0A2S5B740_9BASI|nr:hypothetical protein BMF94_4420 [Rhodotorula taiwanensis]
MGAQGSKPDHEASPTGDDQTFFANRESPFSESLINHLSSQSTPSSTVPASRQQALDAHIQQRIASELQQLRQQEQQVREEIERALEKENLDRERGSSSSNGGDEASADKPALSHSASLLQDLEQLEKRASGLKKERAETNEWKAVDSGKEALERCFRENQQRPLDCRAEAEKFKAAVAAVEKAFFSTLN